MEITPQYLRALGGSLINLADTLERLPGADHPEPEQPGGEPPAVDALADEMDISGAIIHNSPDVRDWKRTARITTLAFPGVHVEHTREGDWPETRDPSRWSDEGGIQFTLWIFLRLSDGNLHGSGCIQFWKGCVANGGDSAHIAQNWYYAADRWDGMTGHQPAPGEDVGFMVSQGDARNNGRSTLSERSAVLRMPFPSDGIVVTRAAHGKASRGGIVRRSVPAGYKQVHGVWVRE